MPRVVRLALLTSLLTVLLATPGRAAPDDATTHRRTTPTPPQQTAEGYAIPVTRRVTYSVVTRGRTSASLALFRRQAQETYDDPRGWRAGGVEFRRVRRGGDFTLVLSVAGAVPSFSSQCSTRWSCRVGRFVIINQTRWQHASPAWNAAGRSLRDYRHMVVNHETGHWLGRGHATCSGGGRAPVMMQQSKGTGGCSFNPWPLEWEAAAVRR
ncbi:Protein of unknown function [Nocardioides exalbidus]|uniref:DUF3152 domain-containing protein n=1 Tax=Nocardioides exalbidus TaxID=402596 RepID=A0A1H4JLA8_9ACTN|nr:DUF3152 domain-containing protein [Nocardioides exalbidus]SEB47111.1 Protein of unknown function [Nocardioides exalbidus]